MNLKGNMVTLPFLPSDPYYPEYLTRHHHVSSDRGAPFPIEEKQQEEEPSNEEKPKEEYGLREEAEPAKDN